MDKPTLEQRVSDLEHLVNVLVMAMPKADGESHIGQAFLRLGLNRHYVAAHYRMLDGVRGDQCPDEVLATFRQHFPHHRAEDLLLLGIAMYQETQGPASRLYMEAALKGMREPGSGVPYEQTDE